jgi:hypothetical protein
MSAFDGFYESNLTMLHQVNDAVNVGRIKAKFACNLLAFIVPLTKASNFPKQIAIGRWMSRNVFDQAH